MGKYMHYFQTESEYNQERSENYIEPWVSLTGENDRVDYNTDFNREPLTFKIMTSGTIKWINTYTLYKTISYSLNNGEWISLTSTKNGVSINVNAGDVIKIKGENSQYSDANNRYCQFKGGTAQFEVLGNIMSLVYGDDFYGKDTLTADRTFFRLFESSRITSIKNLKLPATTLTEYCYGHMFDGCTSLTTAPELPATTLARSCYIYMFSGCTSLTTAPELPATTLAFGCYLGVFNGCTNLTTAPELPATALTNQCYYGMFDGCTSLTTAPELPATALTSSCYASMFAGCTSLTTAPELPATTLAQYCYQYMFQGCTSLTTAPELSATTLANQCYQYMFSGCTGLTTAPLLPAETLESNCYSYMFSGCANLNYIKAMFTTEPSTSYTRSWVNGVAATGTFVKNSEAQWDVTGVNGIPTNWTIQTASS